MAAVDAPLDLVLVLDNSQATGSADPERRLVTLLDELIRSLAPEARVGLVAFDDLATPLVPLTRLADGGSKQIIDAVETLGLAAGHSNYAAGLERAICAGPIGLIRRGPVRGESSAPGENTSFHGSDGVK